MQHSSSSARRSALGIGVSLAAHVAAFLLIPHLPRPAVEQFHTAMVEFEVSPPTPEPQPKPEPEPEPAPEPAPAPVVQAQAPPDARPAAPLPQATPERSPEETPKPAEPEPGPLDLGELADLGGGASVPVGYSGSGTGSGSGRAPVGRPAAAQPPVRRPAPVPVAPAGPVAVKDLRAAPRAPALDGMLARLYPPSARAAGISGQASVRVLIAASGVARVLGVVSESYSGFGSACQQTVQGSRWSAPVDRDGRSVSTTLVYRCHFRVDR